MLMRHRVSPSKYLVIAMPLAFETVDESVPYDDKNGERPAFESFHKENIKPFDIWIAIGIIDA